MASVKINITVNPELLTRIDDYTKKTSISRSGLFSLAVSQYLNAMEMQPEVNALLSQLTAAFDGALSGNLTEEQTKERLESMQKKYSEIRGQTMIDKL